MPEFIANGPVIPDELIQAIEDDRVIIFCGAGISMGAGLPDFRRLVEFCYKQLSVSPPTKKDPQWQFPDQLLDRLENDFPNKLREVIAECLRQQPKDLSMHLAILELARLRRVSGRRLVTTNFDELFDHALRNDYVPNNSYCAPVLPVPRDDRETSWNGIVYLHGRLAPRNHSNAHLILTSADFGRAYLTDGWAARFVSRLFAEFTVLFIGYSLNDPVFRYMMDALAAEMRSSRRSNGRILAYSFVPMRKSDRKDFIAWRKRGIEPIFYDQARRHSQLNRTIVAWANASRDYLLHADTIIQRVGRSQPEKLDPSDVDKLIWAVLRRSDNGHGARRFAELGAAAPIEWLFEFQREETKEQNDSCEGSQASLGHSQAFNPSRYNLGLLFPDAFIPLTRLTLTANYLADWLLCHVNSTPLVEWVISNLDAGRSAHPQFKEKIIKALAGQATLPSGYRRFWQVVIRLDRPCQELVRLIATDLKNHKSEDTKWMPADLAVVLRPVLKLGPSWFKGISEAMGLGHEPNGSSFAHIARAEVKLSGKSHIVDGLCKRLPDDVLAQNADLLVSLMSQALDLYAAVDQADTIKDPGNHDRPSIPPHEQNRNRGQWAQLFELVWRAWSYLDQVDSMLSRACIMRWRHLPYPSFKRLVLAALTSSRHSTETEKIEVLIAGEPPPLWDWATRKEALDMLRSLWPKLGDDGRCSISRAILNRQPRCDTNDREEMDAHNQNTMDRIIVLERAGGQPLPPNLAAKLRSLREQYPNWDLPPGERAHFSSWSYSGWMDDEKSNTQDEITSDDDNAWIARLTAADSNRSDLAQWRSFARSESDRALALMKLMAGDARIPNANVWLWGIRGLIEGADNDRISSIFDLLAHLPSETFDETGIFSLTAGFIRATALESTRSGLPETFWTLFDRTLVAASKYPADVLGDGKRDYPQHAINCPMGQLAEAFFALLFEPRLKVGETLPQKSVHQLERLLRPELASHRPARVIAAAHLSHLHAVDPIWTQLHILHLFAWRDEEESIAVWQGFAQGGRVSPNLWESLKSSFLDSFTSDRLDRLGGARRFLAVLLASAGFEFGINELPRNRVQNAIRAMPDGMRVECLRWIANQLRPIDEPEPADKLVERGRAADTIWQERVAPWLKTMWPHDQTLRSPRTSTELASIAIATDGMFPEAVDLVEHFMLPEVTDMNLSGLAKTEHPRRHPQASLKLIQRLTDTVSDAGSLRSILNEIGTAMPPLRDDAAYRRLNSVLKSRGY